MSERLRWWLVALIPSFVAAWLIDNVPLGSWAPYVFGQMIGIRGRRVDR